MKWSGRQHSCVSLAPRHVETVTVLPHPYPMFVFIVARNLNHTATVNIKNESYNDINSSNNWYTISIIQFLFGIYRLFLISSKKTTSASRVYTSPRHKHEKLKSKLFQLQSNIIFSGEFKNVVPQAHNDITPFSH